jgi:hypothetical protein
LDSPPPPTTTISNTNNRTHDHFYFNHYFYFYLNHPCLSIDKWESNKNGDSSNINIWVYGRCLGCESSWYTPTLTRIITN